VSSKELDLGAVESAAPACGPDEHCITCGDHAVPMRVGRVDRATRLAWCRDADGGTADGSEVDVELVGDVAPGDLVLVHAGAAIVLLSGPEGASA
jgi:hydrogenase maturation factor